jgi:hypothetical protein
MRFTGESRNRLTKVVRSLTSLALVATALTISSQSAHAVAAPTIGYQSESVTGGTSSVTLTITPGDASTLTGYQYSTDAGATWSECNSSKCNWTLAATTLVLQKKSNENFAMRVGSTYSIILRACTGGTPGNASATDPATLGLNTCSVNSNQLNYLAGTGLIVASLPTITTSSTIAHNAVNPSVTIGGSNFETTTSLSLFSIDVTSTGLTAATVVRNSSTSVTFGFTGTAHSGTLSIQANANAYAPTESAGSNTVTITVPTSLPETATAVAGTAASSTSITVTWSAPSYDGGRAITDYDVQYTTETVTPTTWTTFTSSASTSTSRTVTGLTASTDYLFRVRAKNANGNGPYSVPSSVVTTQSAGTPPAPTPIERPIITKLSKDVACSQGDSLVIFGANLKGATVTIDGKAQTVRGNSDSALNVDVDDNLIGIKTLLVTTSGGTASAQATFKYAVKTRFKVFDIPYLYKNQYFEYQFEASGENTYEIIGKLPAGIQIDSATGIVSGTPTTVGVVRFNIKANGICGNDVDQVDFEVDKEIPNAISHRIKFPTKRVNKIGATQLRDVKKFLKQIKAISPKSIDPIVYISGGAPKGEPEAESPTAKDRRDAICDVFLTQDLLAQTIAGIFSGPDDEIEIIVYWPAVR